MVTAFKKKLYANGPGAPPTHVEVHRSKQRTRVESWDPRRLERDVRQMLADKVSGNLLGIWLLVAGTLSTNAGAPGS